MKTADIKVGQRYVVRTTKRGYRFEAEVLATGTRAPGYGGSSYSVHIRRTGRAVHHTTIDTNPSTVGVETHVRPQSILGAWDDAKIQAELDAANAARDKAQADKVAYVTETLPKVRAALGLLAELGAPLGDDLDVLAKSIVTSASWPVGIKLYARDLVAIADHAEQNARENYTVGPYGPEIPGEEGP